MRSSRDSCVTDFCSCKIGIPYILYITTVLVRQPGRSSCILDTLRFSALASCFALPSVRRIAAFMQSSARYFLTLIAMEGMYAGFAGAIACRKKSLFFGAPF
jgi:hypothetical protein